MVRNGTLACDPGHLAGDADLAGLGVFVAFALAGAATLVLVSPLCARVAWDEYFETALDRGVWARCRARGWLVVRPWTDAAAAAEARHRALVLALADAQFVAAAALVAAAAAAPQVSVYHVSVVVDLVWIASGTQVSALAYAAARLTARAGPAARAARLAQCLALGALLLGLSVLQADARWYDAPSTAARCLARDAPRHLAQDPAAYAGLALLVANYAQVGVALFPPLRRRLACRMARADRALAAALADRLCALVRGAAPEYGADKAGGGRARAVAARLGHVALWAPILPALALLRALCFVLEELLLGTLSSLLLDVAWFALGVAFLVQDVMWGREAMDPVETAKETAWTFGQIVALLMVLTPFWSLWLSRTESKCPADVNAPLPA